MAIVFYGYWEDELADGIKEQANEQCPDGYKMEIVNPQEYEAIAQAWNMGIDSHLEALSERSSVRQANGRAYFNIHPDELHVLIRRLLNDVATEVAENLARDIMDSLYISCF